MAYDISDDRRLRRVAAKMESYGDRAQYSVFLCDLSRADLADLRHDLCEIIDQGEDYILIVDLGDPATPNRFEVLGRHRPWPATGPTVL
ncbi:CRISPR-associated endonuclease Cas2 [Saccharopolyspora rosea]|uniref:CRISPR-associated endonuclease Cas2 n=1 Tax=Saccharopolyspora rosea TaxID=524884 RepID=UPI0021DA40F1|nr:CRISPR-associated endonuclease Cas2 [Saccharopolyspora rosea]